MVRCGETREYDVITACRDFEFGKATFEAVYLLSLLLFTLTESILLECINVELVKERVYIFY
jgi:hypothetical protein